MSVCINLALNDVLQTVERPVVFDVVRQLMNLTQISSDTAIRFYGEDGKSAQYNSTLTKDTESDNRWPHQENLMIEVDEDHDPDNMLSMAVKYPENQYVFWDQDLNIIIRPVYSPTLVNVRISYGAKDKNQATKWRNDMRTRTAMMRDLFLHQVNYSWHVPDEFLVILQQLWTLRNNIAGYGDTFTDWLTQNITTRATQTATLNGQDSFLAIAEQQAFVQGYFDFGDALPEKGIRNDEPNLWVTSFTYKFRYDKPVEAVMDYPIVVHQQMLSSKYRPTEVPFTYQSIAKQFSYSGADFANFAADNRKLQYIGNRGLSIPPFDNCVLTSEPASTVKVFLALAGITVDDLQSLMSLNTLGDFNLNQDILDFIQAGEYTYITQLYQSILQLNLYADRRIQPYETISCDATTKVSLVAPGDLRTTYRLRLSLVTDFTYLPYAAIQRLKNNTTASIRICNAINAAIRDQGFRYDIRKSKLSSDDLRMLGLSYDSNGNIVAGVNALVPDPNRIFIQGGLVENLFVIANRNTSK